ncbi:MAG TPA: CHAT domain-containing protein [Thermoanaerobaculia bacterium]|nr:CHAT domain-containing protein [Thermoanaerobaculia bacterium]
MNWRKSSRCPDPEVLAAFVAGTLSNEELTMIAEHIRGCEDCQIILAEVARVDREESGEAVASSEPVTVVSNPRTPALSWWLIAAAAALCGVAILFFFARGSGSREIQVLVDAAPRNARSVEPRLSGGFRWAPLQRIERTTTEAADPAQMKFVGAAGRVLEHTQHDASVDGRHASALAYLLTGHADDADVALRTAAERSSSAAIWNDLAATRYVRSQRDDNPATLTEALAAADAALRIDGRHAEALFNRALIVERLGLREEARAAWQRFLDVDDKSPWADEARTHLARLTPPASFKGELERMYDAVARDHEAAAGLVQRFPQETRVWGESEILSRWAEAWQQRRDDDAKKHLAVARQFGDVIAETRHDLMLRSAVAAIDRASAQQLPSLAAAHADFRAAQRVYGQGRPAEAQQLFEKAAAGFARARSPLALAARYFIANTRYDQGHVAESGVRLEELRANAPADFPSHRAQVEWQLGLVQASQASWGAAMATLTRSIATFEQLNERPYATAVREILAESYDRVGNPRAAWRHRILVLREIGATTTPKLLVTLDSAARGAALDDDVPVGLSLLRLEIDLAKGSGDDLLRLQTLLLRARLERHVGRREEAQSDLSVAKSLISRLKDRTFRERATADCRMLEAYLSPPPTAVLLFSSALRFNQTKGRRMLLPDLLLHRGRALQALGRDNDAAADYEAGIQELESQRSSLSAGDDRWGAFGTAEGLFDEAVALAGAHGRVEQALRYAERARARELLEAMAAPPAADAIAESSNQKDAIVEYVTLPERLFIFVLDHGAVRAVSHAVARSALEEEAARLRRSASAGDLAEFRRTSAILYSHLIAPIAGSLADGSHLAIVPDATLRTVPFAALIDATGHFLVERHAISIAPSAAVYTHLVARRIPPKALKDVLVVEGPPSVAGGAGSLRSTEREAAAVAAVYSHAQRIVASNTDEETLERRASAVEVLHFVGHSVADNGRYPALLTSMRGNARSDGHLDVREIAAMHLEQTRVVVLAACSTAAGEEQSGEGNISVARAFVAAGVPSVVATLWPIDDERAAEFFPLLHRYLTRDHSAAEALRSAQIESIHSRGAPALWAAVQVIGI